MPAPEDFNERLKIAKPLLEQRDPRLTEADIAMKLQWTKAELSSIRRKLRDYWDHVRRPIIQHRPNPRRHDPRN